MVPCGILDGFEVGRPGCPCQRKKGCIEPVYLRGAECGVLSFPGLREEIRPPGLGPESKPFSRGIQSQLGLILPRFILNQTSKDRVVRRVRAGEIEATLNEESRAV